MIGVDRIGRLGSHGIGNLRRLNEMTGIDYTNQEFIFVFMGP